ncbi:MAG: 3-hydroxyacyl-ACP dehydratase FabZ [Chitinispirillaceae bacterium]|nr:3-hydroxyacyl-ACP dehydratase FabZ [Chitinispirillaceae bacterium]
MFDIQEIMKNVPHRYPFLLIDRVIEFTPNQSVTVLKNVSINEAQFQGHFPNQPILPGVYVIENMAQASCFLLAKSAGGLKEGTTYVLGKVVKCTFLHPVVPGDQLITTVSVEKLFGESAAVTARAAVNDKTVAKGELMFGIRRSPPPVAG